MLTVLAGPATAEAPRPGLMWNRSGLPAVFPLQVRTPPGLDWYVELRPAEGDGAAVLAAYFTGGSFFRVLVPPGTFTLHFASGPGPRWAGEGGLFGASTQRLDLDDPLTFGVRGLGTKAGHSVDLRGLAPGTRALLEGVETEGCGPVRSAEVETPRPPAPFAPPSGPAASLTAVVGAGNNPVPLPRGAGLPGRRDPGYAGWPHGDVAGPPGWPYRDAARWPGWPYRDAGPSPSVRTTAVPRAAPAFPCG